MGDALEKVLLDPDLVLLPVYVWVGIPKPGLAKDEVILAQLQDIEGLLLSQVCLQLNCEVLRLSFTLRGCAICQLNCWMSCSLRVHRYLMLLSKLAVQIVS